VNTTSKTILVSIPTEKVWVSQHSYTFRTVMVSVEPVLIMRRACGRHGEAQKRYFYDAVIKPPAEFAPEYGGLWDYGIADHLKQLLRVSISRSSNPKWKPPVFPVDAHVIEVTA
jgi:hypothetical protein